MAKIIGKDTGDCPGHFKEYGGGSVFPGYLLCDGTPVSRNTYKNLFAKIGITFGAGDGVTTFNLPDSRRRVHAGSGGSGTGTLGNATGNTGGEENHTLSVGEMPSHNHSLSGTGTPTVHVANGAGTNGTVGGPDGFIGWNTVASSYLSVNNNGSGSAHNNIQPTLVVTKMIKY